MGLVLTLLLILYLLACVGIYGYVCKKTQKKKVRIFTIIVLVMIGFGDNIVQLSTFYYLCHTQGGLKIYRTVEDAEGYLAEWDKYGYINKNQDLVEKKYKFIEVEVKRDTVEDERLRSRNSKDPIRLPNGKYRYYLAKAGSPSCEYFYKYHSKDEYHKNFPQDYCMAIERIDAFKSRYAYSNYDIDESLLPILRIRKATTKIWDIRTGEILGTMTSFIYDGSWFFYCMYGHHAIMEYPDDKYTRLHSSLLYKVLNPNRNMEVMK